MKLQGLVKVGAVMLFCLGNQQLKAQQLKLGTNPSLVKQSAILELESKQQALLITRIADTNKILSPVNGMIIYLESDNSFRVRANNYWNKLMADGTAITSINNDFSPAQQITAVNTAGTFGFSTPVAGTQTLTIPDATTTAAGFMNVAAQSFKGRKTFTDGLYTTSIRITDDVSTPLKLLGKDGNGDVASLLLDNNLTITTGQLGVKNTVAAWNAAQLQGKAIASGLNPANGQVLKWNTATSLFEAADDITGGASYGNLTGLDITQADAPDDLFRMKIWKGPGNGTVLSGPLGTTAHAWSVLSFRNVNFTTQLYFDKNTLALREWGGNAAPLTPNTGNSWYKLLVTHGDSILTDGGVMFAKKTSDASTELKQDYANFFWDYPNKRLGLGTNAPANTLEIKNANLAGSPAATVSGLRLTNLAGQTGENANANVLSINSAGDVILTQNAAANNWLVTGNNGTDTTSFLGTNNDLPMVIKSNGQSLLEFGRRGRMWGLRQEYDGYRDANQYVTLLKSPLQFDAPGASFYKPMFFVDENGNFRMIGASAGTDKFEFGATGTNNNGGFDFIIGDDGDEPIIFKSYNYEGPVTTEIMRLQSNKVGIGLTTTPNSTLQVDGSVAFAPMVLLNTTLNSITLDTTMYSLIIKKTTNGTKAFTVNLPSADKVLGRIYVIKRYYQAGSGNITVSAASGQTIEGANTKTLGGSGNPTCITVQCISNTEWVIINSF